MGSIQVGKKAPDFTRTDHTGAAITLSELYSKGPVVLFFYPKDNTAVCTQQACSFRDAYATFTDAGAQVVGISSDSDESHTAFAGKHQLPFPLISDADNALRKLFDVPKTMGILPGRVTYVIDTQGTIQHIFNSQLNAEAHIKEALETIQSFK